DHLAAFLYRKQPSSVERVDQYLLFIVHEFDYEVTWHSYSEKLQADPARDLQVENREGDRNPGSAVNHVVEKTVARVEIILDGAMESQFIEEQIVQSRYSHERGRFRIIMRPGCFGECGDLVQALLDVQMRVLFGRDQQRRSIQFQIVFISRDHFGEFRARFFF